MGGYRAEESKGKDQQQELCDLWLQLIIVSSALRKGYTRNFYKRVTNFWLVVPTDSQAQKA